MKEKKEIVVSLEEWRALAKDKDKIDELIKNETSVRIVPKNDEEYIRCSLIKMFLGE